MLRRIPFILVAVAILIAPTSAFAHERRTIAGGKYDVVVGWDVEPAFEGLKNAASIRVSQAGSNPAVPVEGAEKTMRVQIRQGTDVREFPLRTVYGQKGYYVADIVPTRAGDFQWTFVGDINGETINDKFDTADRKFNKVEDITDLQFPLAPGDTTQIAGNAMVGQTIAAVYVLDNSGLHDLDMAIDSGAALPAGAMGKVQNAYIVAAAAQWPTQLKPTATQLTSALRQLQAALNAGDLGAAAAPAHDAHELGHELSHSAYAWLATQGNVALPGMSMDAAQDAPADAD